MATTPLEQGLKTRRWKHVRTDAIVGAAGLSSALFIVLVAGPALAPAGQARHVGHLALLGAHIAGGTVMLIAGAVTLRIGLTRIAFRWHRMAGFSYLAGGMIASLVALIRSFDTKHTPGLSTATLAIVWIAFSAMGWRAVRNGQIEQHREWMIRSYVVAWTFVFCRFYTRAAPDMIQGTTNDMIWLTWITPILLCEIALQWKRGARRPHRAVLPE
jgi:uncharacterized membrane protein YozB (DUF420 family)